MATAANQTRKIKCPHCGWIVTVPVAVLEDDSMATITKGLGDAARAAAERIRAALADSQLAGANAWIDMPACPNCKRIYQYNVTTGQERP
jgi:hypothetical protein